MIHIVMIRFSCNHCKTKVYSFETCTSFHVDSFDEYHKCFFFVFFFYFHFVFGQFKERDYGRIHLSF